MARLRRRHGSYGRDTQAAQAPMAIVRLVAIRGTRRRWVGQTLRSGGFASRGGARKYGYRTGISTIPVPYGDYRKSRIMLRYRLFAVISRFTPTVGLPATLDRRRVNSEESAPLMMRSNNADLGAVELSSFLVQPR